MSQVASFSPESGFHQFDLGPSLQRAVVAAGFIEPRPIQTAAIPAVLAGRDVLGLAQTGTGKTAAFALPILERLSALRRPGPRALILAPTRELAAQIQAEIVLLAKLSRITTVAVFGGVPARPQIAALRAHPDIIVACPGRLLDLMGQRAVRLNAIETLVLDEADHMFDLGFLPSIRQILAALPPRRQNLLFSATMPPEIRKLAAAILSDPHVAELVHSRPAETIEHALYPVASTRKIELLERLLAEDGFESAIVFSRTKQRAKRLAVALSRSGHSAVALQGNMTQGQRDRAMSGFRTGRFDVLVATDIAARGIDVSRVSHVINFDMPGTPDAYTHRIGRTGRAERSGKAYTLVCAEDREAVRALERQLGASIPRRSVEGFEHAEAAEHVRGGGGTDRPRGHALRGRRNGGGQASSHSPGARRPERRGGARSTEARSGGQAAVSPAHDLARTLAAAEHTGRAVGARTSLPNRGRGEAGAAKRRTYRD